MKTTVIYIICMFLSMPSFAQLTLDGNIVESGWTLIDNNDGGPTPGFGAGHEINALYASGDTSKIYFGIAGNVQNTNSILMFIDSKTGGYNDGSFNRTDAIGAVSTFNSSTTFDSGFNADFVIRIGTDASSNYYLDLFTLSTSGSNTFIGDQNSAFLGASPANSDLKKGFEFEINKTALGYTEGTDISVFLMYSGDSGFLSNQFLSPAGSGEGNYGSGAITFGAAAPNPLTINSAVIPEPSSIVMLGLTGLAAGGLALLKRRKRA